MNSNFSSAPLALVTGGALGIGGAVSRRLAADGYRVLIVDLNGEAADRVAAEIGAGGGEAEALTADVTLPAGVQLIADRLAQDPAAPAVLVNNVGDFRPAKAVFHKSTPEHWEALHRVNLWHVFAVSHLVIPSMIAAGRGAIINVSTVEAYRGIPGNAVYSAYKAGVSAFTKSLAVELGPSGIRVNAIAPDLTDTDQTPADAMLEGRDPALTASWLPLGRFGTPDDHAGVVSFLASDDSRFVTGHTIPVDGGTLASSGWYGRAGERGWTNRPTHA
ncbi:SDR family NAD(P)-dependent oxidoreductase [Leucobacter luti]|uniref:SDR family NAD(P)-dependent oxidoreductase n=1 Tax=Leucobacter luti TaxID=340320 RepID=UPI003CFC4A8A